MAKYMVVWELPSDTRDEAIGRFIEGSALEEPEGVTLITRWHSITNNAGWSVCEANDPKDVSKWLIRWSDIMTYEVYPVIDDEEFADVLTALG